MDEKELKKTEQMALRCRTAYNDLLKIAADMNALKVMATADVATLHITNAASKVNLVISMLNNRLAENGVFLGQHFNMKDLYRYHPKKEATIKVDTKWYETETRYVYYTCPPSFDGILIGSALEHKFNDVKFKEGSTPIR